MKGSLRIAALVVLIVVLITLASKQPGAAGQDIDGEDRLAWREFASLVHPVKSGSGAGAAKPKWVFWATKCEVGFAAACDNAPQTKSTIAAELAAAEFPGQILSGFSAIKSTKPEEVFAGRQQFVKNYVGAQQLASVLYNPVAKKSIRQNKLYDAQRLNRIIQRLNSANISGAKRRLPPGSFTSGSEIVKLIWEIIPQEDGRELHLYDSYRPQIEDDTRLMPASAWSTTYRIDPQPYQSNGDNKPCTELPPYGSPGKSPVIPITCFYWFALNATSNHTPCSSFPSDVRIVAGCGASGFPGRNILFLLVGFHVMKLTPEHPDWVWSTYYWTRETNETESGSKWDAPWNHYHQRTVTAIREKARGDHAVCYNPYLEGRDENGLNANCLSCHSFAAYAANDNVKKVDKGRTLGIKGNIGRQDPYSLHDRWEDEQEYFRDAVQTHFVWSISNSQNTSTSQTKTGSPFMDPNSFQNMLRKALQEHFQNH